MAAAFFLGRGCGEGPVVYISGTRLRCQRTFVPLAFDIPSPKGLETHAILLCYLPLSEKM